MAEAGARDRVRIPVECTDRDNGLVMHKDKYMDMFHRDKDFNVSGWECGQPDHFASRCSQQRANTTESEAESCYCHDVGLTYIDERRQMICSLLGGHGGAQLVAEEPSLSWRSPTLQSKTRVWPWASMALGGYGDVASHDRVCLALPRLCDPDPVAPAIGGLRLLGHLFILFPLTLILFAYEQGVSFLPKSYNKERVKENMEIFDWELSMDELKKMSTCTGQDIQSRILMACSLHGLKSD
ncbi:hypothetical protein Syun_022634 [Stephania yunnanensis]|uniref:Uncharacterized protein n=1 Tax=Stephania yunnanensis TaxID=152371 RepID=A0AAP0FDP3_9MAGN